MLRRISSYRMLTCGVRYFCSDKPPSGFEKFKRKTTQNPKRPDDKQATPNPQRIETEKQDNSDSDAEWAAGQAGYKVPQFQQRKPSPEQNDKKKKQDPDEPAKKTASEADQNSQQQWWKDIAKEIKQKLSNENQSQKSQKKPKEQGNEHGKGQDKEQQQKGQKQTEQQQQQQQHHSQTGKFTNSSKPGKGFLGQIHSQYRGYFLYGAIAAVFAYWYFKADSNNTQIDDFFKNYLTQNLVGSIEISKIPSGESKFQIVATVYIRDGRKLKLNISNLDHFLQQLDDFQADKQIEQMIPIQFITPDQFSDIYPMIFQFIIVGIFGFITVAAIQMLYRLAKKPPIDIMNLGSNFKSKQFEQKIKIRFKDVAGLDEAKGEIKEFVDFLKAPSKYKRLGARIPRGALLTGPPGTGKTLLAKACAGEAGVPFFYVSGSEFVEMFVGMGAARVRELFKQAKQKSPSIVFIDEIDAVGKKRNAKGRSNEEKDNTLNQLLVEMDGFGTESNVVVLAATNMKELLDPALTRPGRFDRSIEVTLPDIEGRKAILLVHLKPLKLDPSKPIEEFAKRLATLTPGFSGAQLANLCNEAAILAVRDGQGYVTTQNFELASERVTAGLEKKKSISEEERKVIAYHECGHAIVSWFLEGGDPLLKLTIIPRAKGSLGYAQYLPNESSLQTKEQLLDKICCALGGRISEKVFFNQVTTGAFDDLKKVQEIANAIVTKLGMNESIGYIGYEEDQFSKDFSDKTNEQIDAEVGKIVQECAVRTEELIVKHKDQIEKLAAKLLEKETLDLQAIIDVLGERPFQAKSNYKAYLDLKKVEQQELQQQEQQKQDQSDQQQQQQEQSEQSK